MQSLFVTLIFAKTSRPQRVVLEHCMRTAVSLPVGERGAHQDSFSRIVRRFDVGARFEQCLHFIDRALFRTS